MEHVENVEILHQSSSLGLPYKLRFEDRKRRVTVEYDGLFFEAIHMIEPGWFLEKELLDKIRLFREPLGYTLTSLREACEVFTKSEFVSFTLKEYYLIEETNFDNLSIEIKPNNYCINCWEPDWVVFTSGVGITQRGKFIPVYIGEEEKIRQIIVHKLDLGRIAEIYLFRMKDVEKMLAQISGKMTTQYAILRKRILRIVAKWRAWQIVKEDMETIFKMKFS